MIDLAPGFGVGSQLIRFSGEVRFSPLGFSFPAGDAMIYSIAPGASLGFTLLGRVSVHVGYDMLVAFSDTPTLTHLFGISIAILVDGTRGDQD